MRELKEALEEIPEEVLEHFSVAMTDDGLALATDYTDKGKDESTEVDWMEYYDKQIKEHPSLKLVADYLGKIIKVSQSEDDEEYEHIEVSVQEPKK